MFKRFLCFLNCVCCAEGIGASIETASRSCACAVFRVLCATPFGMADDKHVTLEGLNSISFQSRTETPCSGYVPRSSGDVCLCCEQPHACHVLKHNGHGDTYEEVQFMRAACRVGCMGWDSHPLRQLVHGSAHLGGERSFDQARIDESQANYRRHLHRHTFGSHPSRCDVGACEKCARKSLAPDSLPRQVQDEVLRLLGERRDQFQGFIHIIDRCFVSESPPSSSSGSGKGNSVPKQQQQQQQQQQIDPAAVSSMIEVNEHGVKRSSVAAASQLSPMDQVPRMAADVSGSSSSPPHPAAQVHPLSTIALPSAGASAVPSDADHLALRLRAIKLSDDAAVLTDMSAKLRRAGIFAVEDLQGLSLEELKEAVAVLSLNAVQLKRLYTAVTQP